MKISKLIEYANTLEELGFKDEELEVIVRSNYWDSAVHASDIACFLPSFSHPDVSMLITLDMCGT